MAEPHDRIDAVLAKLNAHLIECARNKLLLRILIGLSVLSLGKQGLDIVGILPLR